MDRQWNNPRASPYNEAARTLSVCVSKAEEMNELYDSGLALFHCLCILTTESLGTTFASDFLLFIKTHGSGS